MAVRCPGARLVGCAALPGYRFAVMRHGLATIEAARGGVVYGVLWRLSLSDLAALHAYENLAAGLYRMVTLAIATQGGRVAALVYMGNKRVRRRARSGYMGMVISAAHAAGLPTRYVRGLGRTASIGVARPKRAIGRCHVRKGRAETISERRRRW